MSSFKGFTTVISMSSVLPLDGQTIGLGIRTPTPSTVISVEPARAGVAKMNKLAKTEIVTTPVKAFLIL